jgi:hypothetical protein
MASSFAGGSNVPGALRHSSDCRLRSTVRSSSLRLSSAAGESVAVLPRGKETTPARDWGRSSQGESAACRHSPDVGSRARDPIKFTFRRVACFGSESGLIRPVPKWLHEKRGYLPRSKLPLHASVFCQFQVAYSACAPGSARARIREKPRRGLPPRRGFSLVARQSPLVRTALIGPLHALASVIPEVDKTEEPANRRHPTSCRRRFL